MRSRIVYMSNIISWKLYRYAFQNMEHKRKNIPIFHSIQSTHLMYNSLSDQWGVTDFVLQVPFICIRNIVVYTDQTKYIIILFSPLYIPTKNKYFISAESCCIMSVRARIVAYTKIYCKIFFLHRLISEIKRDNGKYIFWFRKHFSKH